MPITIAVIDPVLADAETEAGSEAGEEGGALAAPAGVTIRSVGIDIGPASIESRLDDDLAAVGVVCRGRRRARGRIGFRDAQ
jgi:hypothetical protein